MISEIGSQAFDLNRSQQQATAGKAAGSGGQLLPVPENRLPDLSSRGSGAESIEQAAEKLNQFMQAQKRSLQFSRDESSGRTVIKVINTDTNEVVKQFPPEEILSLSKTINESLQESAGATTGLLLEEQV